MRTIIASCRAEETRQDVKNPWLKLFFGVALVILFMFGAGWLGSKVPGAERMAEVIDTHNLRPTAIFYTDFDAPYEGSAHIRDALMYPPRLANPPDPHK